MSIQAMARVMESSTLTGAAYYSLLVIANHEGDRDGEPWAWPSVDTVAREARISRRAAMEGIRTAERAGELVTRMNEGPRGTNLYHVHVGHMGEGRICPLADERRPSAPEPKELRSTVSTSLSPTAEVQSGARSRDELWELLFLVQTGEQYNPSARISGRERSKVNAAAKDLRSAGFTAQDVSMGIGGWPVAMGDARITALGLSANMSRCLNAAAGSEFRQQEVRETVEDRALKLVREHMAEQERLEIGEVLA